MNKQKQKNLKAIAITEQAHTELRRMAKTEGRKLQFLADAAIRHYVGLQASEKPDSSQDDSQFIQAPGSLAG